MKLSALFAFLLVLSVSARPARAEWTSNTNAITNLATGASMTPTITRAPPATPSKIGNRCGSPENPTVLLALLCAGGLLAGSKLRSNRSQRQPLLAGAL